jgi:hypothetical protein
MSIQTTLNLAVTSIADVVNLLQNQAEDAAPLLAGLTTALKREERLKAEVTAMRVTFNQKKMIDDYNAIQTALKYIHNQLAGAVDTINSDELTPQISTHIARNLEAKVSVLETMLEPLVPKKASTKFKPVEPIVSDGNPWHNTLQAIIEELKRKEDENSTTPDNPDFDTYGVSSTVFPVSLPRNFSLVKAPIIPVFKSADSKGRNNMVQQPAKALPILKSCGIPTERLLEYIVCLDQYILIVPHKPDPLRQAIEVLETLKETRSWDYSLVVQKPIPNPRTAQLSMFWVIRNNQLTLLTSKGLPIVETWGVITH